MPNLTLRTLLGYIDDTVSPGAARTLGKAVAESEKAQELVERIKRVTRRRGLQTPVPSDPDDETADPNVVAAYLDNSLDSATVKQVEETCLESDVHLAEVAACHQILTLVLTEPARVPPRARRRMYDLLEPPASQPGRRPDRKLPVGGVLPPPPDHTERDDADAALLFGMRRYSASAAGRLSLLGAAVALLLILLIAVVNALSTAEPAPPQVAPGNSYAHLSQPARTRPDEPFDPIKDRPAPVNDASKMVVALSADIVIAVAATNLPVPVPDGVALAVAAAADWLAKRPVGPDPGLDGAVRPPSPRVREIAARDRDNLTPSVIVTRPPGGGPWAYLREDARANSSDTIMALPGHRGYLLVDGKVQLYLWGGAPERIPMRVLESKVILHDPPTGFDADLTLFAGRIYLKSKKTDTKGEKLPVVVRVRIPTHRADTDEVWDLTIPDHSTNVLVERIAWFAPGTKYSPSGGEKPRLEARVAVSFSFDKPAGFAVPAPARAKKFDPIPRGSQITWDSASGELTGPTKIPDEQHPFLLNGNPGPVPEWAGRLEAALSLQAKDTAEEGANVRRTLESRLVPRPPFDPDFDLHARLAAYGLAALADGDDAEPILRLLIDELGKEHPEREREPLRYTRYAVVTALVHWLARDVRHTEILRTVLVAKGFDGREDRDADELLKQLRCPVAPKNPNPKVLDVLLERLGDKDYNLPVPGLPIREAVLWNLTTAHASLYAPVPLWVPPPVPPGQVAVLGRKTDTPEYQRFLADWKRHCDEIKAGPKKPPEPKPDPKPDPKK